MARIEEIERRLLNWARWKAGESRTGRIGYARTNWGADVGTRGCYREARIPTSDCEAEETDRAIAALTPFELRETVSVYYLSSGEKEALWRLQCARQTMHARIGRAHLALQHWLAEQYRTREQERARVEKVGEDSKVFLHLRQKG
jgi:hypothetical protein